MQHLYPQQHGSSSSTTTSVHHSASEIEAFRARQRMQFRYQQQFNQHQLNHQQQQQLYQQQQQHLQSLHAGNQAEEHFISSSGQAHLSNEQDDRVRKVSLTKRRQQLQQRQQQQQQQAASSNRQATKLPNFGVDRRHLQQQQHHQHQHQLHSQYVCEDDMPSPVPHEAHVMFNAFDFGNSPEAFADQQQHDNNYKNNNGGEGDQQMQQEDDEEDEEEDCEETEKSIWRRRFAADDAHLRRLPKLGQDALWDSPSSVGSGGHYINYTNNQFSHQHQQYHQYENSSHLFYQQ